MTWWTERVAEQLAPTKPMTFEEFDAQHPTELVDLIDRAQGRPVRTTEQHYRAYVARMADPDAQVEIARKIAAVKATNAAELAVLGAEDLPVSYPRSPKVSEGSHG